MIRLLLPSLSFFVFSQCSHNRLVDSRFTNINMKEPWQELSSTVSLEFDSFSSDRTRKEETKATLTVHETVKTGSLCALIRHFTVVSDSDSTSNSIRKPDFISLNYLALLRSRCYGSTTHSGR